MGLELGSIIKLGQKEPRPFTVRAASVETKIGSGQRKMLKCSKQINFLNTACSSFLCYNSILLR